MEKVEKISVIPVAYYVPDEKMRRELLVSDVIRHETLRRLCAIPSYPYKSLAWKNRYYDVIKRKVQREIEQKYMMQ